MADGRDKQGKKVHVFERRHEAVFFLIWTPWMDITTEGGDGRNDGCSTQESLACLEDVKCMLKIVIRILSAVETSEVLQED